MISNKFAPIIIFAFNRPDALQNTIQSLLRNEEAAQSDLYVFVDGARKNKPGEDKIVENVRQYVKSIKGFQSLHYEFSEENKGLGNSIIRGVGKVISEHGKAIVLEDDLVLAPNFLSFMNLGLEQYAENKKVFSICGYSNKVKVPSGYQYDAYFCTRSSSWGWATWADRWESVDWELKDWTSFRHHARAFNRWGGSDCWKMLSDWHDGKNKSWAIRFCFAQYLQDKASLFPTISKVDNNGFDGDGTNCKKWSRFHCEFDITGVKMFKFPEKVVMNNQLYREAMKYHSIAIRVWSKFMYMLHK